MSASLQIEDSPSARCWGASILVGGQRDDLQDAFSFDLGLFPKHNKDG
jgi:hypothetical protein